MNQKRRETTTIATATQLRSETPIAVPAVEFVAAHPSVTMTINDCPRCRQPRDLDGRCSCSFEVSPLAGLLLMFVMVANAVGCATAAAPVHPSPRAQAVAKCLAAEDAGQPTPPACKALAPDVAALRLLSTMAGRS